MKCTPFIFALLVGFSSYLLAETEATHQQAVPSFFTKESDGITLNLPISNSALILIEELMRTSEKCFIASGAPGYKSYSLSSISTDTIVGLVQQECRLNNVDKQRHPLYDQQVTHMVIDGSDILAVEATQPAQVHYMLGIERGANTVVSSDLINDASGTVPGKIETIAVGLTGPNRESLARATVAVVKDAEGNFGSLAGFALLKESQETIKSTEYDTETKKYKEKEETKNYATLLDPATGLPGNKAFPLEQVIKSLVSNQDGTSVQVQKIILSWHGLYECWYVGISGTTKSCMNSTDKFCAIGLLKATGQQFTCEPIAPFNAVDTNEIISTFGPNKPIFMHHMTPYVSSMGAKYLIVVGGSGDATKAERSVYALPLVGATDKKSELAHPCGTLAAKNSTLRTHYLMDKHYEYKYYATPAETADQCITQHDDAALVGGGKELPGAIEHLSAIGEAIYVTIKNSPQGAFYSHPIFDADGVIRAWTEWTPVAGASAGCLKVLPQLRYAQNSFLEQTSEGKVRYRSTRWYTEDMQSDHYSVHLASFIKKVFPTETGGVESLVDAAESLGDSWLVATGNGRVAFVNTLDSKNGTQKKYMHDYASASVVCEDGVISAELPELQALVISGGQLKELGHIVTSHIVTNGSEQNLWVGGIGGIARLSSPDGRGWSTHDNFDLRMLQSMKFEKIGNFKFVKKIIQNKNAIFILTRTALHRIHVGHGTISEPVQLLSSTDLGGAILTDLVILGPCALVGTAAGLYRTASGADVRSSESTQWTRVELAKDLTPVSRFFVVSGGCQDLHRHQVYVITGSTLQNVADFYRLYVEYADESCVTDSTLRILMCEHEKNLTMPFLHLGSYRQGMFYNGVQIFTYSSRTKTKSNHVDIIAVRDKRGGFYRNFRHRNRNLSLGIDTFSAIHGILPSSIWGDLMIYGDFGIRIHG